MAKAELRADPAARWGGAEKAPTQAGKPERNAKRRGKVARGPRRSVLGFLIRWSLVAAIWMAVGLAGYIGIHAYGLPDVGRLGEPQRSPSIVIATSDGTVVSRIAAPFGPVSTAA